MRSVLKSWLVTLAVSGRIPYSVADTLIRWLGLREV
jgi:hypothetical protein